MKANKSTIQYTEAEIITPSGETVFSGPDTCYTSVGSVSYKEVVWVCWAEEGYYYIEYKKDGTNKYKSGYVPMNAFEGTVTNRILKKDNPGIRYVMKNSTTYYGYNASYLASGSVSRGETVGYLGLKVNNYAFIEYRISNAEYKLKRAWVLADNLSTTPPAN